MDLCKCCPSAHQDIPLLTDLCSIGGNTELLTDDIIAGLGETSLNWFEELTESYLADQQKKDGESSMPGDDSVGWSPCPRGGLFTFQVGGSSKPDAVTPITALLSLSDTSSSSPTRSKHLEYLCTDQLDITWTSAMATPQRSGNTSVSPETPGSGDTSTVTTNLCSGKPKVFHRQLFSPVGASACDDSLTQILEASDDVDITVESERALVNEDEFESTLVSSIVTPPGFSDRGKGAYKHSTPVAGVVDSVTGKGSKTRKEIVFQQKSTEGSACAGNDTDLDQFFSENLSLSTADMDVIDQCRTKDGDVSDHLAATTMNDLSGFMYIPEDKNIEDSLLLRKSSKKSKRLSSSSHIEAVLSTIFPSQVSPRSFEGESLSPDVSEKQKVGAKKADPCASEDQERGILREDPHNLDHCASEYQEGAVLKADLHSSREHMGRTELDLGTSPIPEKVVFEENDSGRKIAMVKCDESLCQDKGAEIMDLNLYQQRVKNTLTAADSAEEEQTVLVGVNICRQKADLDILDTFSSKGVNGKGSVKQLQTTCDHVLCLESDFAVEDKQLRQESEMKETAAGSNRVSRKRRRIDSGESSKRRLQSGDTLGGELVRSCSSQQSIASQCVGDIQESFNDSTSHAESLKNSVENPIILQSILKSSEKRKATVTKRVRFNLAMNSSLRIMKKTPKCLEFADGDSYDKILPTDRTMSFTNSSPGMLDFCEKECYKLLSLSGSSDVVVRNDIWSTSSDISHSFQDSSSLVDLSLSVLENGCCSMTNDQDDSQNNSLTSSQIEEDAFRDECLEFPHFQYPSSSDSNSQTVLQGVKSLTSVDTHGTEPMLVNENVDGYDFDDSFQISPTFCSQILRCSQTAAHDELPVLATIPVSDVNVQDVPVEQSCYVPNGVLGISSVHDKLSGVHNTDLCSVNDARYVENHGVGGYKSVEKEADNKGVVERPSVGNVSDFSLDDGDDEMVCAAALQAESADDIHQVSSVEEMLCTQNELGLSEVTGVVGESIQHKLQVSVVTGVVGERVQAELDVCGVKEVVGDSSEGELDVSGVQEVVSEISQCEMFACGVMSPVDATSMRLSEPCHAAHSFTPVALLPSSSSLSTTTLVLSAILRSTAAESLVSSSSFPASVSFTSVPLKASSTAHGTLAATVLTASSLLTSPPPPPSAFTATSPAVIVPPPSVLIAQSPCVSALARSSLTSATTTSSAFSRPLASTTSACTSTSVTTTPPASTTASASTTTTVSTTPPASEITARPPVAIPDFPSGQSSLHIFRRRQKKFLYPNLKQTTPETFSIEEETAGSSAGMTSLSAQEPLGDAVGSDTKMNPGRVMLKESTHPASMLSEQLVRSGGAAGTTSGQSSDSVNAELGPPRKTGQLLGFAKFSDVFQMSNDNSTCDTSSTSSTVPPPVVTAVTIADSDNHSEARENPCVSSTELPCDINTTGYDMRKLIHGIPLQHAENQECPFHGSVDSPADSSHLKQTVVQTSATLVGTSDSASETDQLKQNSPGNTVFDQSVTFRASSSSYVKDEEDIDITSQMWSRTEFSQMQPRMSDNETDGWDLEDSLLEHAQYLGDEPSVDSCQAKVIHSPAIHDKSLGVASSVHLNELPPTEQSSCGKISSEIHSESNTSLAVLNHSKLLRMHSEEDNLEGHLDSIFQGLKQQLKSQKPFVVPFLSKKNSGGSLSTSDWRIAENGNLKVDTCDDFLIQKRSDVCLKDDAFMDLEAGSNILAIQMINVPGIKSEHMAIPKEDVHMSSAFDVHGVCSETTVIDPKPSLTCGTKGFSTASGKAICISENAKHQALKLMQDSVTSDELDDLKDIVRGECREGCLTPVEECVSSLCVTPVQEPSSGCAVEEIAVVTSVRAASAGVTDDHTGSRGVSRLDKTYKGFNPFKPPKLLHISDKKSAQESLKLKESLKQRLSQLNSEGSKNCLYNILDDTQTAKESESAHVNNNKIVDDWEDDSSFRELILVDGATDCGGSGGELHDSHVGVCCDGVDVSCMSDSCVHMSRLGHASDANTGLGIAVKGTDTMMFPGLGIAVKGRDTLMFPKEGDKVQMFHEKEYGNIITAHSDDDNCVISGSLKDMCNDDAFRTLLDATTDSTSTLPQQRPQGDNAGPLLPTLSDHLKQLCQETPQMRLRDGHDDIKRSYSSSTCHLIGQLESQIPVQQSQNKKSVNFENSSCLRETKSPKDIHNCVDNDNSCTGMFNGFVTARGGNVLVSETALLQAKKMLCTEESAENMPDLCVFEGKMLPATSFTRSPKKSVIHHGGDQLVGDRWHRKDIDEQVISTDNSLSATNNCSDGSFKDVLGHQRLVSSNTADMKVAGGLTSEIHAKTDMDSSTMTSGGGIDVCPSQITVITPEQSDRIEPGTTDDQSSIGPGCKQRCFSDESCRTSTHSAASAQHDPEDPSPEALLGSSVCNEVEMPLQNLNNKPTLCDEQCETDNKTQSPRMLASFSTSYQLQVPISKTALRNSASILNETVETSNKTRPSMTLSDLSAASKLQVSVTENVSKKARNCLEEFGVAKGVKEVINNFSTTASGSIVSETALEHAHSLDVAQDADDVKDTMPVFSVGFSTARGSKVSVSEKALQHAKSFLGDAGDVKDVMSTTSVGFSTAKGSKVSVSEKALQHAKSFLGDAGDVKDVMPTTTVGFSTASGSKVSVSEKALQHAKSFLGDTDAGDVKAVMPAMSVGFSTARGSKVSVSEKALQHAKSFLTDASDVKDMMPTMSVGFSTASGSKVSVSEKALQHAKSFLGDAGDNGDVKDLMPTLSVGFSTARGSKVSVSEKALHHAKSFLGDTDAGDVKAVMPAMSVGFSTAHGSKVSVSEKALQHAKSFLTDASDVKDMMPTMSVNFSTASGSKVSVSEKALQHAKSFLGDAGDNGDVKDLMPTLSVGFSTARGSKVSVSEKALHHAKSFLGDTDAGDVKAVMPAMSVGFSTARGSKVSVSEKALQHAKCFLTDAGDVKDMMPTMSVGFSTASGSKVSVSEKALQHAKSFLGDTDAGDVKDVMPAMSLGFSTASGSKVSVSEKALQHAKSFLTDGDQPFDSSTQKPEILPRTTSSGALPKLTPSMANLRSQASGRLLQNAQNKCSNTLNQAAMENAGNSPQTLNSGFSTATGLKIYVSEEALRGAKDVLDSAEDSTSSFKAEALNSFKVPSKSLQNVDCLVKPVCSGVSCATSLSYRQLAKKGTVAASASEQAMREDINDNSTKDVSNNKNMNNVSGLASSLCQTPPACVTRSSLAIGVRSDHKSAYQNHLISAQTQEIAAGGGSAPQVSTEPRMASGSRWLQKKESQTAVRSSCEGFHFDRRKTKGRSLSAVLSKPFNSLEVTVPPAMRIFQPPDKKTKMCGDSSYTTTTTSSSATITCNTSHSGVITSNARSTSSFVSPSISAPACKYSKMTYHSETLDSSNRSKHDLSHKKASVETTAELGNSNEQFLCEESNSGRLHSFVGVPNWSDAATEPSNSPGSNPSLNVAPGTVLVSQCSSIGHQPNSINDSTSHHNHIPLEVMLDESRMKQDAIIRNKRKRTVRPVCGRWLEFRKRKETLKTFQSLGLNPETGLAREELLNHGLSDSCLEVNCLNAGNFRFDLRRFYPCLDASVLVGDGALLVPDKYGFSGAEEFYRALLTLDGVDPKLVDEAWVQNHYRWIVWKLAAYEVCFPGVFAGRSLTPEVVMLQLKYRYDREIDGCHRSAIKKILERDDTPCKRLILCVASVTKMLNGQFSVELTDGWYVIPGQLDDCLTQLVARKRIRPGDKIVTSGAELIGCVDGCSPLELKEGTTLKLHGNSTRPAPWYSRLGYCVPPSALCVPLRSLSPTGGLASCVDVVFCRKYPVMYMEKLQDGSSVFRTAEEEDRARQRHEDWFQMEGEKMYMSLQKEMEENIRVCRPGHGKKTHKDIKSLWSGQDLASALEEALNPEELQQSLSSSQFDRLVSYRQAEMDRRQQEINRRLQEVMADACKPRHVTPVVKFKVHGCCRSDVDGRSSCHLVVWRPGSEWMEVEEGKRYKLFNVSVSSGRGRSEHGKVALTATRQTRIQACPINDNLLDIVYSQRDAWTVSELLSGHPFEDEFDFVGVVIQVVAPLRSTGPTCVFAADKNRDILCIRFWANSLSASLRPGQGFVASNLILSKSLQNSGCRSGQVSADARSDVTCVSTSARLSSRYSDQLTQVHNISKTKGFLLDLQTKLQVCGLSADTKHSIPGHLTCRSEDYHEDFPPEIVDKIFTPMSQEGPETGRQTTLLDLWNQKTPVNKQSVTVPCSSLKQGSGPGTIQQSSVRCSSVVDTARTAFTNCVTYSESTNNISHGQSALCKDRHLPGKTNQGDVRSEKNKSLKRKHEDEELENSFSSDTISKRKSILRAKMSKLLAYERPAKLSALPCGNSPATGREFKSPIAKKL